MSTPIFILGPPRSGTSIMCLCLRKALKIQGFNEGHFLKFIPRFEKLTQEIFDGLRPAESGRAIAMGNIDQQAFFEEIQIAFKRTYEKLFDGEKKYWVDKTAGTPPQEVERIRNLWPEAKFILLKRRSLENIASSRIKFPHLSFKDQCQRWTSLTRGDQSLDRESFKGRMIELDHFDLLFHQKQVAEKLTTLLPEYKGCEGEIERVFQTHFPESSSGGATKILDLETIDWTEEQKKIHIELCGETLDLMGYSLDKNYFKRS